MLTSRYPASRGPSIFLDKSGRGRDLCQPPRLSLICRSSTETDESVRFETCFFPFLLSAHVLCWKLLTRYAPTVRSVALVKFADVSLSKDVFDKAVKSALGRVNTHGISNLTQHQSKALLYFLCGRDSFVCLPTGHGKSLIYQLEQKNLGCGCFRTKKFYFWFERESMRRCTSTLIFMAK